MNPTCKADREKMAARLEAAMVAAGATVTREPPRDYAPRRVTLNIAAPGGAVIAVSINGETPDFVGGTWNTRDRVFLSPALGDVNPFHFGKLNVYCSTLDGLIWHLERHLAMFADGSGYLPESDPRLVAMRSHYRSQGWSWFGEAA